MKINSPPFSILCPSHPGSSLHNYYYHQYLSPIETLYAFLSVPNYAHLSTHLSAYPSTWFSQNGSLLYTHFSAPCIFIYVYNHMPTYNISLSIP